MRAEPPRSTRFRVIIASLIALTSLLGAVAAWRAESASMKGEHAEHEGFANGVADQQERSRIRSELQRDLLTYERSRVFLAQAEAFRKQAGKVRGDDAVRLRTQGAANARLARVVLDSLDPSVLRADRTLDLTGKFERDYAAARVRLDLDPRPEFALADRQGQKSRRLVGLTALLIGAAFFFTLAQVLRTRATFIYVGAGVAVLVGSTALLLVVAVTT